MCSSSPFEENDVVLQQNGNSLSGETESGTSGAFVFGPISCLNVRITGR